mmetsp:Transcript_7773/g.20706  ORF Transcript_7773/g.20706 Transcript_7773/m.20706 type:complete len:638 (+) Transcript_7773:257-2170(+)
MTYLSRLGSKCLTYYWKPSTPSTWQTSSPGELLWAISSRSSHIAVQQYRASGHASAGLFQHVLHAHAARTLGLNHFLARHKQHLGQHLGRVARRWAAFEQNIAAVGSSLSISASGQKLLASVLPFAVVSQLFPWRFQCLALEPHFGLPPRIPEPPPSFLYHLIARLPVPYFVVALIEELNVCIRGTFLLLLFLPAVLTAHAAFWAGGEYRKRWMQLMIWTLHQAGPAFIKWGQWAATRPDLFPLDLCHSLEQLQTKAPAHPAVYSRGAIEAAFGFKIEQLFSSFEDDPVASGSIAQIHRGKLSQAAAVSAGSKPGKTVAIKVRHPGVTAIMHRDFVLMERAAKLASAIPGVSELRLDESIRQFGGPLKEQLDLAVEAGNLMRFKHNFRMWSNVTFPSPMYPLVASDVLVESFEEGLLISKVVNQPGYKHRLVLAETGLMCFLQMLLCDNFIHADLHPGNILVRERSLSGNNWLSWLLQGLVQLPPKVVFLDTGMIAELSKPDQGHLIDFFRAMTKQDGEQLGKAILEMSERHTCKNPKAFLVELKDMFDSLDPQYILYHTSNVIESIIETLRHHQVTLRSTVSTVVVTTLVLEGWSSKLNPELRILDHVRDMLVVDWNERMSRTVDKVMKGGALAVA